MKVCAECGRCYHDSVDFCTERNHHNLSRLRDGDPEMITGYQLEYLLESGVRGESYRAQQTESGRPCLIRILSASKAHSEQFSNEARLAAAFFHANVIDVYEVGATSSGELFVVAEDAGGKDLRGFLDSVGVPDLLTSIEIIRQSAEALDALHREGMIHRAVNPENIILTNDANGRLLVRIQNPDFGGVVQTSIVSNKFLIDSAIDSLRYFAPEQCSGDDATPQTDVYSLGVVFYEMLAGVPPFDATKAVALIEKHRTERPPDVRIDNFNLRMLVTHALTESLQKQPKLRQRSANALARQLRHIEQLANHVSTPPPAGLVLAEPVRNSPNINIYEAELRRPVIQPIVKKSRSRRNRPVVAPAVENESSPVIESVKPIIVTKSAALVEPITNPIAELVTPVTEVVAPDAEIDVHESVVHLRSRLSRLKIQMKTWRSKLEPQELDVPPQAIMAEPNLAEAVVLAKLEEPVIQPTKVELEIEDDVPTVYDVLEIMAKEQIEPEVVVLANVEVVDEEVPHPKPIVAVQAVAELARVEEDIRVIHVEGETTAAIPEVVEAVESADEVLVIQVESEIPVIKVEGENAAIPDAVESVKIEEEVPVAYAEPETPSIPAMAERKYPAVRRKRRRREPESSSVTMKLVDPPVVKTSHDPVVEVPPIKRETTIPIGHLRLEDALEGRPTTAAKPVKTESYARIPWVKGVLKTPTKKEAVNAPIVRDERDDLEEITLVRVPRPIKIDVAPPARSYGGRRDKMFSLDTQDSVRFVPTLLGDTEKRRTIELDPKDAMFSSLGSQPRVPPRVRRRLIAAGGVSVLLVVAFLFGDDLGRYLQAASWGESSVASSGPPAPPVSVAKAPAAKTEKVKGATKTQPVEKESKPTATKEESTAAVEKLSTSTTRNAKPSESNKPKSVAAANRPVEKKVNSTEKNTAPAARKNAAGTRARIVDGQ